MAYLKNLLFVAIGFAICYIFMNPKTVEKISIQTKTTVDTVLVPVVEKIPFSDLAFSILEDSVEHYKTLYAAELENLKIVKEGEPFSAPLRRYSGFTPTLYGNIGYNAVVAGKVLDFDIVQDLRVPHITNRIETTKTITRDLRGVYAGASVSSDINYKLGASYVDRDWQVNAEYQPRQDMWWFGVRKRIF